MLNSYLATLLFFAILTIDLSRCHSAKSPNDPNDIGEWQFVSPNEWNQRYQACRGARQSPINIVTSSTVYNNCLGDFLFENYDLSLRWNITFDGFSVGYTPIYTNARRIRIGGSNFGRSRFDLLNFHFHWGNTLNGSEHYVNGRQEAAEVHLVHRGTLNGETRFTVLGFFFTLSTQTNRDLAVVINDLNRKLDFNNELKVKEPIISEPFALNRLIPNLAQMNRGGYYRYDGSLTVPPCTEGIIWNVFRNRLPISAQQTRVFNGNDNFSHRPVQSLNRRVVQRSFINSRNSKYF